MQIIDISDETKLLNALQTYASEYFDSFDITVGEKSVNCIVNQDTVLTLGLYYKPDYWYTRVDIGDMHPTYGMNRLNTMYVFENGILLLPRNGYTSPLLICKRNDGDTAIMFFYDSTYDQVTYTRVGDMKRYLASIDRDNGNVMEEIDPVTFSSNVTANVLGYTPFSKYDGITLKDVYIVTDSDFRSHTEPFTYSLNGQTYTGIGGNYFAVKGN